MLDIRKIMTETMGLAEDGDFPMKTGPENGEDDPRAYSSLFRSNVSSVYDLGHGYSCSLIRCCFRYDLRFVRYYNDTSSASNFSQRHTLKNTNSAAKIFLSVVFVSSFNHFVHSKNRIRRNFSVHLRLVEGWHPGMLHTSRMGL